MNAQQLKAFLNLPEIRESLNWIGLERVVGLKPRRIKSVCVGKGGDFRPDEVEKLNNFLQKFSHLMSTYEEREEYT
ncbi:hypothetical protein P1X15_29580 [Runella sp. MFBS21]|uniref:hypothetical protein n=1 Tax=Runella sp. MFBS21 TaxID=3034018 RepID=UPI0023F96797|nr:hypothetical protein [Runella sp. MFBS21]MDF7821805.1 hypothetical protein [Runella sp. MFBS21]